MGVKNNLTLHKGFALVPSFLYQDSVLCVLGRLLSAVLRF